MRKQLLCTVAALAIAAALDGTSFAADLPLKAARHAPPPPAVPMWSGWYVGGHIGYGDSEFYTTPHEGATGANTNEPSGIVGGMHGGYNWQINSWVFGLEADLSATGWRKHSGVGFGTTGRLIDHSVSLLGSLRGRLGFAFDRTLLYVTGGLAYTRAKFLAKSPDGTTWDGKYHAWGTVFGGGVEWRHTPNLSWRLEGLWYSFDKTRHTAATSHDFGWSSEFRDAFVVRAGATYHFR